MATFQEITCQTACNRMKGKNHPFSWDLNIYRGCQHGCIYCYAVYSHKYLESERYFDDIYVKTNIAEVLERQLASPSWNREIVNIGGVTDSYQPAEAKYQLMPDILRLMIKYKTPCIISTKSDLILRDMALIEELAAITYVNVAATITCMDERMRKKIEPGGVPSSRRFQMLTEMSKTNASRGLHFMPIIPYLTDNYDNVDALYANAQVSQVDYVLPGMLYLRGKTRYVFFAAVKEHFPQHYQALFALYKKGGAGPEFKSHFYQMENQLRRKYGLSSGYTKVMREKMADANQGGEKQLSLFDL